MVDIILTAIPFFIAFIVIEVLSLWLAPDDDEVGYEVRDTVTSLTMGIGSVGVGILYKASQLVVYAALYAVTPLRLDTSLWWAWVVIFFAEDLAYYWYHRAHHEVRHPLGQPRRAPLERALQLLDGAAPDVDALRGHPVLGAARAPRRAGLGDLPPAVDLASSTSSSSTPSVSGSSGAQSSSS